MGELLLNLSLAVFMIVDLTRDWCPLVIASDAAQDFGYGVCLARADPDDIRQAANFATATPHHLRSVSYTHLTLPTICSV
eukprot:6162906-Karenia_brevis.AAC.1